MKIQPHWFVRPVKQQTTTNVHSADKLRLQMQTLKAASNPINKDAQKTFTIAHKIRLAKKQWSYNKVLPTF
jgi:hypothetical protein